MSDRYDNYEPALRLDEDEAVAQAARAMLAVLIQAREIIRAAANGESITDFIGTIVDADVAIAAAEAAGIGEETE